MARLTPEDKILAGRKAVEAYRTAHAGLHSRGWHKGISEEHTPLLNELLAKLKEQGFSSLNEFFTASEELNIKELGYASKEEYYIALKADSTLDGDGNIIQLESEGRELTAKLREMWH